MAISNPSLPSVPEGVHVDELALDVGTLTIAARTTAPRAVCPQCGQGSARVHSAYWRPLKELPWQDRAVTWRVRVRRFRCGRCPGRRDWLAQRPRYHVRFTPTSASWINQVERWFGLLTERAIRRGGHCSVDELERDIRAFIDATNADPKPFRWGKSADAILATVKRFCLRTLDADPDNTPLFSTSGAGH